MNAIALAILLQILPPRCGAQPGTRQIVGTWPLYSCVVEGDDCQWYAVPCSAGELNLIHTFHGIERPIWSRPAPRPIKKGTPR